jgi:glycosyltransferase involved in cell wall biosynthesis
MKIAIVSHECLWGRNLSEISLHVCTLAESLADAGDSIHVFTPSITGQDEDKDINNVSYHFRTFEQNENYVEEVQHMCRRFAECVKAEHEKKPFDIVHAHDWPTCNALAWIKDDVSIGGVLTLNSIEPARIGHEADEGVSKSIADHEQNGLNRADCVMAVCHSLTKDITDYFSCDEEKMLVVRAGLNIERYSRLLDPAPVKARYNLSPFDKIVLFHGQLEYRFGPDLMLEAIPEIIAKHHDARFIFTGSGPLHGEIERLANERGLGYAVRFASSPNEEDRRDLIIASEMVVLPTRNAPFNCYALEGWASCKPIVATPSGGCGEYIWHEVTGLHIFDRPDSVAWGVNYLLDDPDKAAWMGNNGIIAAKAAFNSNMFAENAKNAYRMAMAKKC